MEREPTFINLHWAWDLLSKNIDWTNAFVGAQMLSAGQQEIYSYDRDFDRIIGLTRLKPQEA